MILKQKLNINKLFFLGTIIICSLSKVYPYSINIYFTYSIAMIWIIYTLFIPKKKVNIKIAHMHTKLYIIPVIIMVLYTFMIWLIRTPVGSGSIWMYISRTISTNVFLIISVTYISTAFCVFGRGTVDILWLGITISYGIFSILRAIIHCGIIDILIYVLYTPDVSMVNNYLETHDVTFAFGILFLYYVILGRKLGLHNWKKRTIWSLIFIWLGYKRIEILALVMVLIYYYFFECFSGERKKRIFLCISCLGIAYLFIASIYTGVLQNIAQVYDINFNYRLDTWTYWTMHSNFSPAYLGKGINFVDKETYLLHLANGLVNEGYVVLSGMHSDLLKKYVELGFIGFASWLWYILYYKAVKLGKMYGRIISNIYIVIVVYLFILYFTDNVYNYFITNVVSVLIPMTVSLRIKEKTSEGIGT